MKSFADHFAPLAAAYARHRPSYPPALFDAVASLCAKRGRAWDCACGSGQATLPLAARFETVIATDASAAQIDAAPRQPNIVWRVAPAEASGIDGASVDLIAVAQSLHWFDVERFYAEARRVARAGAVLAVWTYDTFHVDDEQVDARVQRVYGEMLGPYWPPERRHVESGYRTLPFPFDELDLPPFSMQAAWTLARLLGMISSWSAVGRYRAERGLDPLPEISTEISQVWGDPARERTVRWPITVRAARLQPP